MITFTPTPHPPWTGLGKRIESMIRKALFDFELLDGAEKLGVALSGGKDSLTMLYMLKAILGKGTPNIDLYAFHISGEFSCGAGIKGDFLQRICDQLKIPFFMKESHRKREELECYSCSRERRKMLFDLAKSVGVEHIAFGHHRDDSIQTLLLNLLHKAEFSANLAKVPMREYAVTIVRPLLYVSEREIVDFAKHYGFQRITCQCPVGQNSKRKVVESLLQTMEDDFPNARKNLFEAAKNYGSKKAISP